MKAMHTRFSRGATLFFLFLLFDIAGARSLVPEADVALGRPYVMSPAPNYPLTTDPADAAQLTDGKRAGQGFWTDKSTVGWLGARPVSITIELASVTAVTGVSFSSAAGISDVAWPEAILVFGSLDGRTFTYAGDLVALDRARGGPPGSIGFARHDFATHSLDLTARYVRLMVDATGPYVFVDEIEVYGRPAATTAVPHGGMGDTTEFFWHSHAATRLRMEVSRTIDAAQQRLMSPSIPAKRRAELSALVSDLKYRTTKLGISDWAAAAARYPLNDLHVLALGVIGAVEEIDGSPKVRAWAANPWDPLTLTAVPDGATPGRLDIALMNGEVRAGAVNVRNSSGRPVRVNVALRFGESQDPAWIEAREVAWTGDADGRPVAAALLPPLSQSKREVTVPGGVTSQLWLSFAPTSLTQGIHEGALVLTTPDASSLSVPVSVRVLPGRFPARTRLHIGGWDYLNDGGVSSHLPDDVLRIAAVLRAFGVDVAWATASAMPFGRFDADGNMKEAPTTAVFDAWITRWPAAARYRVFVSAKDDIAGVRRGTSAFDAAVRGWALFWANYVQSRGITPAHVEILFVDEPHQQEQALRQLAWARALKASGSGLRVWADPTYPDFTRIPRELVDSSDVLCVSRRTVDLSGRPYWDFVRGIGQAGKTTEVYVTDGPATRLDPYSYYRLQAWVAFDAGATGIGFWSFTDTGGGSSYNEYMAPGVDYAPLFLDRSSALPGKHLAAIREGAEDYEYLAMLRDAITAKSARRAMGPLVEEARAVLARVPARVLTSSHVRDFPWASPKDRAAADAARPEIAGMIERLGTR